MERKKSVNHNSIVEQLNNLTLELEQLRTSKSDLENKLISVEKSKEDELFEASEQVATLNSSLENSQRDLQETQKELVMFMFVFMSFFLSAVYLLFGQLFVYSFVSCLFTFLSAACLLFGKLFD